MTRLKSLNKRQEVILSFLEQHNQPAPVSAILAHLEVAQALVSRMTVHRDLQQLKRLEYIVEQGAGRGAVYALSPRYQAIKPINVEAYFKINPDKRHVQEQFNFEVFSLLEGAFTPSELQRLNDQNKIYLENIRKLSPTLLKREYERITIDLSWKSSQIEGNTYTILETEYLLKEHKEPKGHTKEETAMILNHKAALDYIRDQKSNFKRLTVRKIEEIHSLLVANLKVAKNIRTGLVRVGGTNYRPLDNKFQIREALEKLCQAINREPSVFAKALMVMLLVAYIQPFEDGNKRTSRLMGNALLIAHGACPMSFRNIDELEYKKAILLFYEQNNFRYFKELFMEQVDFAVNNYFG